MRANKSGCGWNVRGEKFRQTANFIMMAGAGELKSTLGLGGRTSGFRTSAKRRATSRIYVILQCKLFITRMNAVQLLFYLVISFFTTYILCGYFYTNC